MNPDPAPENRRWELEPRARRSYLALCAPGGQALERVIGAPPGFAVLQERLLYRQSSLADHAFDRMGGKFGMAGHAESTVGLVICAPEVTGQVLGALTSWWREPAIGRDVLGQEVSALVDHVTLPSVRGTAALWRQLDHQLFGSSHLTPGRPDVEALRELSVDDVMDLWRAARALGTATVVVSPQPPPSGWPSADFLPWLTPPVGIRVAAPARLVPPVGGTSAVCAGARATVATTHSSALGALGVFAALHYGRSTPEQTRFHRGLCLQDLTFQLVEHQRVGLLTARASCPGPHVEEVTELLTGLLDRPARMDGGRLKRCARHHLEVELDNLTHRVMLDARALLSGAPSLARRLAAVSATDPATFETQAAQAFLGPSVLAVGTSRALATAGAGGHDD